MKKIFLALLFIFSVNASINYDFTVNLENIQSVNNYQLFDDANKIRLPMHLIMGGVTHSVNSNFGQALLADFLSKKYKQLKSIGHEDEYLHKLDVILGALNQIADNARKSRNLELYDSINDAIVRINH